MKKEVQRLPIQLLEKSAKRVRHMGHPQRLRILEYLDLNGTKSVSAIVKAVNGKQVIVSQSLKRLKQDGFVMSSRIGRFMMYSLASDEASKLLQCMRRGYAKQKGLPEPDPKIKPEKPLPAAFLEMVAEKINFIGHPLRLRILEFLDTHGESSVSDIMEDLKMNQIYTSQSLKRLKQDGIVSSRRDGRFIFYKIKVELPRTLIECMRRNSFSAEKRK